MSDLLKEFFTQGVEDQLLLMGQECKITDNLKSTTTANFQAIITSRDGSTEVEVSGITYSITGHALIPANLGIYPKVGQRIDSEGELWLIVSVVKSALEAAYSCDLVRVK